MFKCSYFELFGLPVQFDLDRTVLTGAFRELQARYHPDKFAHASDAEQRESLQASSFINQAYQALKSPAHRAAYMLELAEDKVRTHHTMRPDPEFLMQQMMWRESLAEASDLAAVEAVLDDVGGDIPRVAAAFDTAYRAGDFENAHHAVDKLQFMYKLMSEAEAKEARLLDE